MHAFQTDMRERLLGEENVRIRLVVDQHESGELLAEDRDVDFMGSWHGGGSLSEEHCRPSTSTSTKSENCPGLKSDQAGEWFGDHRASSKMVDAQWL